MNIFLRKIGVFLIVYFLMSITVSNFVDYHHGNQVFSTKMDFLESREVKRTIDVFFFGSSRVFRGVDPDQFDRFVKKEKKKKITSFNLGSPNTQAPESYFLYEQFLSSEFSTDVKYCFLELTNIVPIGPRKLHAEQTTYWINLDGLQLVGNSFYNNDSLIWKLKLRFIADYVMSYFENMINLGQFGKDILEESYHDEIILGERENGFLSLSYEMSNITDPVRRDFLLRRRQKKSDNNNLFVGYKAEQINFREHITEHLDQINLHRIQKLIELSEARGIHLFLLLLPPKADQRLINLSKKIPDGHLLDLSDPRNYTEFYTSENYFDPGHLNDKGARLITKRLAEEFCSRIDEQVTSP